MDRAVHLRQVNPAERVVVKGAIEQSVGLGKLPVVADEGVEPKAKIDVINIRLEWIFDDEVILVALPLIGASVREDAEVAVIAGPAIGVLGIAVLEPAVDLHRFIFGTEKFHQQLNIPGRGGLLKLDLTRGVLRGARKADATGAGAGIEGPLDLVGRDARHDTTRGGLSGSARPLRRLIRVDVG